MTFDLDEAVRDFAQELQDLLDNVLPVAITAREGHRRVQAIRRPGGKRHVIRIAEPRGMITLVRTHPTALLRIEYRCGVDSTGKDLTVERSDFELRSLRDRSPLVRLDYLRDAHKVPAAHWNVHAERGSVSHLLASNNPTHSGQFSELHFPVGGARMRPCLEDFIQFIADEFRIDLKRDARRHLAEGREKWRRRQISTLVRDAPEVAAETLVKEFNYTVAPPSTGHPPADVEALRAW